MYRDINPMQKKALKIVLIALAVIIPFISLGLYTYYNVNYTFDNAIIKMKRTACFEECPTYSLTIHGNGTIVYEGYRDVKVEGKQIYQGDKNNIRELIEQFYAMDYFALNDSYAVKKDRDLQLSSSATITSITIVGKTKSVYNENNAGPQKLKELEDKIDVVARSYQWIN